MNEAVTTATLGLAISMGGIVVLAAAAGILVAWIENRIDRSGSH